MRLGSIQSLAFAFVVGVALGHVTRPAPVIPAVFGVAATAAGAWLMRARRARATWVARQALSSRSPVGGLVLVCLGFGAAGALMAAVAWRSVGPGPADVGSPGSGGGASKWVVVAGTVVSEPRPTTAGYSFLLEVPEPGPYWRTGERFYVSVRTAKAGGVPAGGSDARGAAGGPQATVTGGAAGRAGFESGAEVEVRGFLSRPRPPGNPGEFDFPRYLAVLGVRYVVNPIAEPIVLRAGSTGFATACRGARNAMMAGVGEVLSERDAALLAGLLFGDTSRLPEDVARDFRRAGVYHILAVSGSNVAFVAGGFWFAVRPLLRLTRRRGRAAERAAWPLTALVLAAYAVMTGLGPSVLRATLMAEAGLVYLWLGRRRDPVGPLCLAALIMLFRQPLALLDPGFQLSFAATLGLILIHPVLWRSLGERLVSRAGERLRRPARAVAEVTSVSLAAQAAVIPVLAWHFGEVSLAGIVANTVVVPCSGFAVTAGLAAGVVHLAGPVGHVVSLPLFRVTSALLRVTTATAGLTAHLPFASVITGAPAWWIVVAYYLALAWVVRGAADPGARGAEVGRAGHRAGYPAGGRADPRAGYPAGGRATRRAVLVGVTALALGLGRLAAAAVLPAAPTVAFLDVGQGDAIFLDFPGGRVLIDGGPAGAGEDVIGPFLRHRGVGVLAAVIVTHAHGDHVGGLLELLQDPGISVGEIVLAPVGWPGASAGDPAGQGSEASAPGAGTATPAAEFLDAAARRGIPVREVSAGATLRLGRGGYRLSVLWPYAAGSGPYAASTAQVPAARPELAGALPAEAGDTRSASSRENDDSLVLLLEGGPVDFLFPGDLESTGERALLDRWTEAVSPGLVLKVGHHGSGYSTSQPFLEATHPGLAVVSVGTNTFGHPSAETLDRLAAAQAFVFITQDDGAVLCTLGGGSVLATGYRSRRVVRLGPPSE